jgi:hypothetical protein
MIAIRQLVIGLGAHNAILNQFLTDGQTSGANITG